MRAVGLVANPASGKDIRRLTGKASVFDNREKLAIVRRAVVGAIAAGAQHFIYMNDSHGIVRQALAEIDVPRGIKFEALPGPESSSAMDTVAAAEQMAQRDCAVVLVLGGDGTNRAFVRGWRDSTLISLSTGTNNVFPVMAEATVAGMALGLVARGQIKMAAVADQVKIIDIEIEDEEPDIALIDAVLTTEGFIGARALMTPEALREAFLCRAEPAAVGITSLGGLIKPVSDRDEFGLHVTFSSAGKRLYAPMSPGTFESIGVGQSKRIKLGRTLRSQGPGVLAFDGERERVVGLGQKIAMQMSRTGPKVINLSRCLHKAATQKLFVRSN